ncbi:TfoX/Sxy family protein [Ideonella sp. 4Y11]|uniref:TfoX/Sxy family protein n=1 Tax=Ideonella aquatica TaxID=2824119 RepID=A0A940YU41_9BURK|nr:TfoX/Sxy family protein [Ideonella aquatica]MBQ0961883.1 TfoX/Sxy family protein [Ideonella aquatica]
MSTDKGFVNWCAELLAPLGAVRTRRMFGGHGFYVDDLFIALEMREVLYLKVDASTQPRFEAAGSHRFEYTTAQGEHGSLSYWSAPEEAMDAPSQLQPWGRLALEAALRAQAAKAPKARRAAAPRSAKPRRPASG